MDYKISLNLTYTWEMLQGFFTKTFLANFGLTTSYFRNYYKIYHCIGWEKIISNSCIYQPGNDTILGWECFPLCTTGISPMYKVTNFLTITMWFFITYCTLINIFSSQFWFYHSHTHTNTNTHTHTHTHTPHNNNNNNNTHAHISVKVPFSFLNFCPSNQEFG